MTSNVRFEREQSIATVTVDRPEKRNAMDNDTRSELRSVFETVDTDDTVRCVVLRGAGDSAFIVGGDIDSFSEFDLRDGLEYTSKYAQGLYNEIAEVSKPTIAAIDGYALGGGTEIALACDFRLATPDAKLGLPEIDIGIFPAGGGTQRLVDIVGLAGDVIDANEAERIGLVNYVYESENFGDEVQSLASQLTEKPPIALQLAKESLNRAVDHESGLDFERVAGALALATEDKSEGVEALLEGRDPKFQGK
jgi:enoyl-CoA hydratase